MNTATLSKHFVCTSYWLLIVFCISNSTHAQDTLQMKQDVRTYQTYFQNLIVRVYSARKYTTLNMFSTSRLPDFKYRPNTYNGLGIGITYRALTLNLGYGFGFLFNSKEKGKTTALDFQTRFYARRLAVDAYAKTYTGFYLSPKTAGMQAGTKSSDYYTRRDIRVQLFGASVYRMFNGKGFSLRPAFVQDVRQKRSGGSFLAGAEWFFINVRSDSSMIPQLVDSIGDKSLTRINMLQVGPGGGYAYTRVLPHNLFVTGYLTANVNIGLVREAGTGPTVLRTGLHSNLLYRLAIGYDNGNYNISAYVFNNRIGFKGASFNYVVNTGNVRIMFAKRFKTTRTIKKYMNLFNILID